MCNPADRVFIPVPNVMRVQLVYSLYSQSIGNVFNVLSGGGLLTTDLDRVEAVFASWWTNTARATSMNQVSLVRIVVDALNVVNGLHKEYTSGWTAGGSLTGTALPGQNTCCVKLSTQFSGRSFRGRIYWNSLSQADVSNGLILATRRDAIVSAVGTLRTNLSAGGDTLVVVSYCSGGLWRSVGVATPVTGQSSKTTITQQKRRRVAGA
jgi:hypothetical protein